MCCYPGCESDGAPAEAERERRAKVITRRCSAGAETLAQAVRMLQSQPRLVQLRYLQNGDEIAAENNSTTLFPFRSRCSGRSPRRPTMRSRADSPGGGLPPLLRRARWRRGPPRAADVRLIRCRKPLGSEAGPSVADGKVTVRSSPSNGADFDAGTKTPREHRSQGSADRAFAADVILLVAALPPPEQRRARGPPSAEVANSSPRPSETRRPTSRFDRDETWREKLLSLRVRFSTRPTPPTTDAPAAGRNARRTRGPFGGSDRGCALSERRGRGPHSRTDAQKSHGHLLRRTHAKEYARHGGGASTPGDPPFLRLAHSSCIPTGVR